MNAKELLQHLQEGAVLRSRWRMGKFLHTLKLPSGETLSVQRSNIKALIKGGALHSIALSGDNYDYYLARDE